jgi:hypothetical protein
MASLPPDVSCPVRTFAGIGERGSEKDSGFPVPVANGPSLTASRSPEAKTGKRRTDTGKSSHPSLFFYMIKGLDTSMTVSWTIFSERNIFSEMGTMG